MNNLTICEIETLRQDGELATARVSKPDGQSSWLVVSAIAELPAPSSIAKLENAFELRGELETTWAARPLEIVRFNGHPALISEDPGGEFLDQVLDGPLAIPVFLRLAIGMASSLGSFHRRGLLHREIKPAHFIVDAPSGKSWLTGFGLAWRLPRHRQAPDPIEVVAGTLAYMAPEQTGRMNRSIDSRSDLYSLGVTFYEMLTGRLPFVTRDLMELVHCHTAIVPVSPNKRLGTIPDPVSAITMKLLAKTAEERYQTAAGVEWDLQRCLFEWEKSGLIPGFPLGEHDIPDRLMIPEKLYGRGREVETLLSAFARIVAGGRPELVLVSGYSGIGKSVIVNELHKLLVPPRGLFASGKFDQYKRDIPYATLAQAFQGLVRPLLSKSEEELEKWRAELREALEPNGALIVELVPELQHIIGEQPPVPELPPRDAQARFQLLIRRFIYVFARPEHPLALFLDDLQWLDAATLDLLEDLLSRTDLQHLLLIGAYRDNEVHATHPLMQKLDAMRRADSLLHDIVLTPLRREDLDQLLADSLRAEPQHVAPLAQLIHEKTSGNPFFAIQFIETLADEGLLTFDHAVAKWSWNLSQIHAKSYTDNVVELMVGKLSRLPLETQRALQRFACLGSSAEFPMLQMVDRGANGEMHEHLWAAVRAGLVFRSETSYRFLHDRVQEAAYSLIPQEQRAEAHLQIGRLLVDRTPSAQRDEAIFEIVNQLNRGIHLITSIEERERVAGLDLIAAKRAKHSTAYTSALKYLRAGRSLLTDATWERHYDLIFSIECLTAECELLTAEMAEAEKRLTMLAQRAKTRHDFALVTRLQLTLYTTLDRSELAIDISLDYLRREGTNWSHHPTWEEVMAEYNRVWTLVGEQQIEDLVDLPRLIDPDIIDMLDVFTEIVHPAMFYDENLSTLVVCRMVNLSLEHGNCDASSFGYVWLAMFAGPRFNNYKQAFRFGQLGYDLVEKYGFENYKARTYLTFATLTPWARHAAKARELVHRAFDVAYRMGDLTFSTYSWHALVTNCLTVGDPLKVVQAEAEKGLDFARKMGFGLVIANCEAQLGLIRTLRGLTPIFGCLDHENYTEARAEAHFADNPVLVLSECFYWTRKIQARFFAGDYASATQSADRAYRILWTAASQVETGDFRFYAALAHAAAWHSSSEGEKKRHIDTLAEHHRQLEIWAQHCPENFENRAALVSAEIARIEGRLLDAEHLYEKAIHSSQEHHFIQNEALANELAAQFYRSRGFATPANAYLRNARACYEQWGAQRKVDQIDASFPQMQVLSAFSSPSTTIETSVAQMDAETVIKAAQTLSSEMDQPSLIQKLLRLAIEHAGAQRGLLILVHNDGPLIEAEARYEQGIVEILIRHEPVRPATLPISILQYVLRTRERVLIDDASSGASQSSDEYIRLNRPNSVLCLPILKQTRVIGALYLENNLMSRAFTAGRVAVLEVLASQGAISLENARLYAELAQENREREQAEGEMRKLISLIENSTDCIGYAMSPQEIAYLNAAWRKLAGLEMDEDLAPYQMADFTPEYECRRFLEEILPALIRDGHWEGERALHHIKTKVVTPVHQTIFFISDAVTGRRIGIATICRDITERKRAEQELRKSEMNLRKAEAELAHITRVATMGELAASIAHEINQPIAGVVINGNACLRWLSRVNDDSVNLAEARNAVERIVRDGRRAGDVIGRIRAFFKKTEAAKEPLDIAETIREIIVLARSEMDKQGVTLRLELSSDLPEILGDRVQLQQVILNLILNAIDAMAAVQDRARRLIIRTQRYEERQVLVTVRDSGVGLRPECMEDIFAAFHTTKPGGLGMGLPISRSIVENHSGRLWVTGNEEHGASFHFTLPMASQR